MVIQFSQCHLLKRLFLHCMFFAPLLYMCGYGFPGGLDGKKYACKAGDLGSIPGLGAPWVSDQLGQLQWAPLPLASS